MPEPANDTTQLAKVTTTADLVSECDEVRAEALCCQRGPETTEEREARRARKKDLRTALAATELKAKLLGLLKDGKANPKDLSDGELEKELRERGYDPAEVRRALRALQGGRGKGASE